VATSSLNPGPAGAGSCGSPGRARSECAQHGERPTQAPAACAAPGPGLCLALGRTKQNGRGRVAACMRDLCLAIHVAFMGSRELSLLQGAGVTAGVPCAGSASCLRGGTRFECHDFVEGPFQRDPVQNAGQLEAAWTESSSGDGYTGLVQAPRSLLGRSLLRAVSVSQLLQLHLLACLRVSAIDPTEFWAGTELTKHCQQGAANMQIWLISIRQRLCR
jgi:hypothetical protein